MAQGGQPKFGASYPGRPLESRRAFLTASHAAVKLFPYHADRRCFRPAVILTIGASIMRIAILTLCAVLFASCSRMTGSLPLPANPPSASALGSGRSLDGASAGHPLTDHGYKLLSSFQGGKDGAFPYGGLVANNDGKLYGTTYAGGGGSECGGNGCGIIFGGGVLHSFLKVRRGGTDGAGPMGTLFNTNGVLYGTTTAGGIGCTDGPDGGGCGIVFALTLSGTGRDKYRVLYRFKGDADGEDPVGGVSAINGSVFML